MGTAWEVAEENTQKPGSNVGASRTPGLALHARSGRRRRPLRRSRTTGTVEHPTGRRTVCTANPD